MVRSLRFKLETSWRVEAAELIDALPAFDDLPEDVLSDLAGRIRLRILNPGEPVFRQGDRPDAFYVVRRGSVQIEDEDPETGDVRVLRTMGRGESFGEMGLLGAHRRQATVRPTARWSCSRSTRARSIGCSRRTCAPRVRPHDAGAPRTPRAPRLPRTRLGPVERSARARRLAHRDPGEEIITQGAAGDRFYAIASGRADVLRDGRVIGR